jgi:hypothetical protein
MKKALTALAKSAYGTCGLHSGGIEPTAQGGHFSSLWPFPLEFPHY